MSTASSDPTASDPERVRLSWPGEAPRTGTPQPRLPDARAAEGAAEFESHSLPRPTLLPLVDADASSGSALRRAVIDAYDRLAERILQRLRAVHEDLGADLSEVRSDLTSLRQAVDDLGDRVQLRQMRSSVDDLRSDVAGLRRAVIEWPELERVSSDLTALRSAMSEVSTRVTEGLAGRAQAGDLSLASLAPLVEEIASLRLELQALAGAQAATSDPVITALAGVREELISLRRRIALRVGGSAEPEQLSDTEVGRIAEAVAERLVPWLRGPR